MIVAESSETEGESWYTQQVVEADEEKAAPGEPVAEAQAILFAAAEARDEKDRRAAAGLVGRQGEDRDIMDGGGTNGNGHLHATPKWDRGVSTQTV